MLMDKGLREWFSEKIDVVTDFGRGKKRTKKRPVRKETDSEIIEMRRNARIARLTEKRKARERKALLKEPAEQIGFQELKEGIEENPMQKPKVALKAFFAKIANYEGLNKLRKRFEKLTTDSAVFAWFVVPDKPKVQRNRRIGVFGGTAAAALALTLFLVLAPSKGDMVIVDGHELGIVKNAAVYEQAYQELFEECDAAADYPILGIENDVVLERRSYKGKPLSKDDIKSELATLVDWEITGVCLNVSGGEPVAFMSSKDEAGKALDLVKNHYAAKVDAKAKLVSADFAEEIGFKETRCSEKELKSAQQVAELLINGSEQLKTYEVKSGDSLWDIAYKNNLTVSDLKAANPQLKSELLSIGQELNLVKVEPLIHVVCEMEVEKEEKIARPVVYENLSSLYVGQTQVKSEGKDGLRTVTYRLVAANGVQIDKEVLEEVILEEPEKKVVYKGTKTVVASRGSGSGVLAWPLVGRINSAYGNRRLGYHTGIDINGNTGDAVRAAGSGTVIRSSYYGSYGNCIDIDHGNGLMTRYAHLSKLGVSVGKKVAAGDYIGAVGSTGRSTGPHLHFEVRVNGVHKNPTGYLK